MLPDEDNACPSTENKKTPPPYIFFYDFRNVLKNDELGREIARIAFPAALGFVADPIASIVDTAFVGQIGPVELGAVGLSVALLSLVSRITIFPLVSITTSFVAEEDTIGTTTSVSDKQETESLEKGSAVNSESKELIPKDGPFEGAYKSNSLAVSSFDVEKIQIQSQRKHIPSASTALVIGAILGFIQAIFLISGAKPLLHLMGISSDSPMLLPAQQYLTLRALGAPAVLLSTAMQGAFRGLKDAKTPLYAIVIGDVTNLILDPIFMFVFGLGVRGAAIAHVISQYLITAILFWRLVQQVDLLPPSIKHLTFSRFLKNGSLLLIRVLAVTFFLTLSASLASRLESAPMAAFEVCLQVWLATSLLADGYCVAGQALLAGAFAKRDYAEVTAIASRVLQLGLLLGLMLAAVIGVGLGFGGRLFTNDVDVLHMMIAAIPFVAGTLPINAVAYVFDGVFFGSSDYAYAAYSMVMVSIGSTLCLIFLSSSYKFIGLWIALAIFMSLRASVGFLRLGTGSGPWNYLKS
ncbi:protein DETOXIFICATION 42 [Mercurialis annua]|uniref:protein DETOXIFICATION 42 n=1 Tax=Mercurialis annua TaxID=3986 RepID=UPI00215F7BEC|nr:protein DETOXIFICATION 42 [Mercurialis annua]